MSANDAPFIVGFPYNEYGVDLKSTPEGHGYLERLGGAPPVATRISPPGSDSGSAGSSAPPTRSMAMGGSKQVGRKKTPEELKSDAEKMMSRMQAEHSASMQAPVAVQPSMSSGFQLYGGPNNVDPAHAGGQAPTSAPQTMLDRLQPVSFNYKQGVGEDPRAQQYGVMAQDLEKTPMGASVVRDTPMGKMIDTDKATGAQFAALADHQDQLNDLRRRLAMAGGG